MPPNTVKGVVWCGIFKSFGLMAKFMGNEIGLISDHKEANSVITLYSINH